MEWSSSALAGSGIHLFRVDMGVAKIALLKFGMCLMRIFGMTQHSLENLATFDGNKDPAKF